MSNREGHDFSRAERTYNSNRLQPLGSAFCDHPQNTLKYQIYPRFRYNESSTCWSMASIFKDQMLRRRGTYKEGANPAVMAAAFEKHLREVYAWLEATPYVKFIRVSYHEALKQPEGISRKVAEFLGVPLGARQAGNDRDHEMIRLAEAMSNTQ